MRGHAGNCLAAYETYRARRWNPTRARRRTALVWNHALPVNRSVFTLPPREKDSVLDAEIVTLPETHQAIGVLVTGVHMIDSVGG